MTTFVPSFVKVDFKKIALVSPPANTFGMTKNKVFNVTFILIPFFTTVSVILAKFLILFFEHLDVQIFVVVPYAVP